jgi:hypothetical protein
MFRSVISIGCMMLVISATFAQTSTAGNFIVTPQVGPWMILVASYRGEEARLKAEEMCQELRSMKVPAYLYNRAEVEQRKEAERIAAIRELRKEQLRASGLPEDTRIPIKTIRIEDQLAVLVGGFKDDVAARKYLDEIRKLKPSEKLQLKAWVAGPDGKMREQAVNPFQSAFVCRNPSIPVEKASQDGAPDPRLKEYNAGESYSLLKCPKPWTLVVRSYQGAAVVESQNAAKSVMSKFIGSKSGELLNANAQMAHQLAESLRSKQKGQIGLGLDAYVLHTEYSSYVTVGGFDGPDDPKLQQMQQSLMSEMNNPNTSLGRLNIIGNLQLLPQPLPMPVPQLK